MYPEKYVYRYSYDEIMKKNVYRDCYECQINRVATQETGIETYLHPKNSTTIAPEIPEGYIAIWENNIWIYEEDYKKVQWYFKSDGKSVTYPEYKNLNLYTKLEKPSIAHIYDEELNAWKLHLETLKENMIRYLDVRLNNRENEKVEVSFESPTRVDVFDSNERSVSAISNVYDGIKDIVSDVPVTAMIRTYNNEMIELNKDEVFVLLSSISNDVQSKKQLYWVLKDEINNAKSYEELSNIFSTKLQELPPYEKHEKTDNLELELIKIFKYRAKVVSKKREGR